MTDDQRMKALDDVLSHVWMVRAFLKHCEEAEEDDELQDVQRALYDYMLALGNPLRNNDAPTYLKQARKKLKKLNEAAELFAEIQPEISSHTNFLMANQSLTVAVGKISDLLS